MILVCSRPRSAVTRRSPSASVTSPRRCSRAARTATCASVSRRINSYPSASTFSSSTSCSSPNASPDLAQAIIDSACSSTPSNNAASASAASTGPLATPVGRTCAMLTSTAIVSVLRVVGRHKDWGRWPSGARTPGAPVTPPPPARTPQGRYLHKHNTSAEAIHSYVKNTPVMSDLTPVLHRNQLPQEEPHPREKRAPEIVQTNAAHVLGTFFSRENPDENYASRVYWPDMASVKRACRVPDSYTLIEPDGRALPCCLVEIARSEEHTSEL